MGKKILLADDSVTIRKVVELSFMEEDYELTATGNGREALEKLHQETPDLVIADVHMGDIGGFEVCRESKTRYPEVPVLLLVGTFEPFDPADVEAHGADAFLKKPFDSQDLLSEVGRLLEEAQSSPEEPGEVQQPAAEEEGDDTGASLAEAADMVQTTEAPEAQPPAPETAVLPTVSSAAESGLSDADVDRIARRVVELISEGAVRDIAWEVIPDMAEVVIKERLRELEGQVE